MKIFAGFWGEEGINRKEYNQIAGEQKLFGWFPQTCFLSGAKDPRTGQGPPNGL